MSKPVSHKDYSDDEIRQLNERFIASDEMMQLRIVTQMGIHLVESQDEIERLRDVEQANLTMAADLIEMEGIIKDLRHELTTLKEGTYCAYCGFTVASDADGSVIASHIRTCERHPMRDVEAENERLRTTLASIEEYGTEEINAGIELRQELARLHKIIADATGHSKDGDGVDLLCKALYGRPGQVPDWLGGSEARMLYDAVEEIEELRAEAHALDRLRAWRAEIPSERSYLLNEEELCLGRFFLAEWEYPVAVDARAGTFAEMVDAALVRWAELYEQQ